eukprot:scaffold1396_cov73-Phaeocystis_antarctica.AAC.4
MAPVIESSSTSLSKLRTPTRATLPRWAWDDWCDRARYSSVSRLDVAWGGGTGRRAERTPLGKTCCITANGGRTTTR